MVIAICLGKLFLSIPSIEFFKLDF